MERVRLDWLLVDRGLAPSRERAQALILAGLVVVGEHRAGKPGQRVPRSASVRLKGEFCPYVSRGGLKLEAGLREFRVDPRDRVCVDVGASTGGFTDCLLQAGARRVYAIDVGYGQLAWRLREDPRVVVLERQNFREMPSGTIPEGVDLVVADASFISLRLLLPKISELLRAKPEGPAEAIVLVKPQFEVGRGQVGKGGVVRDEELRLEALEDVIRAAELLGFEALGRIESPVHGAKKGNVEYLVHLKVRRAPPEGN
jgi:23S rRNA (cytidine1920-2'-O)/16S rRNA (cytidine1409-2'-O)-methyltransferase